jgi:hypothetical protein
MRLRPLMQIVVALVPLFFGAYLVGVWMVGVTLMLLGGLVGFDAVMRDTDTAPTANRPMTTDTLERWRHSA